MYLLLLGFGALLALAGVALSAAGISIHERALDTTIVTPGIVAIIGGLVLIGLGLALRVLQRIENALATQPMPRPSRSAAHSDAAAPAFPVEPARTLNRTRTPLGMRRPAAVAASAESAPEDFADRNAAAIFPQDPPAASPAEAAVPVAVESDEGHAKLDPGADLGAELAAGLAAALALDSGFAREAAPSTETKEPASEPLSASAAPDLSDDLGLLRTRRAARAPTGTMPGRTMPRLDLSARFPLASERPKGPSFETMWQKAPRPPRAAPSGGARPANEPTVAATTPASAPSKVIAQAPAAAPTETSHPVSVLKSGIVDGMAYRLFSDGSIEAALPQGTLRFGSISELRQHIEQSA